MNKVYLLLGGNTGNRMAFMETARKQVEARCGRIVKTSSVYETAAWGKTDQPAFLNQVIAVHTRLSVQELLTTVLGIEKEMGRVREEKYAPRIIDIDILFFNNEVIHEPGLQVPHPEIQNRRFVLEPMTEIAPRKQHPVLGKTMSQLLNRCTDPLEVKKHFP